MAEYLIQDTTLDAIADAINAKTGGSSAMTPAEMVTAIGSIETGGVVTPNIADFLSLVPTFDSSWTTAQFSLLSYPSDGQLTLPNPLGEIPDYAVVIKTDISLNDDLGGCIGGYNFIGMRTDDNALNRTICYIANPNVGTDYEVVKDYGMFGAISNTNWNLIANTTPAVTANTFSFRCGTSKNQNAGFCLGNYILAVKKVSA